MTDLTDAEIMHRRYSSSTEELLALWDWLEREHPNRNRNTEREYCYRAGLAAGRARAIEECARVCDNMEFTALIQMARCDERGDPVYDKGKIKCVADALKHCAAALRALNAPAASVTEP